MKKRSLLFLPFIIGLLWMSACIEGDNYTDYRSLAIIKYDSTVGDLAIHVPGGIFAAPEIAGLYKDGDCIKTQFRLDFDNQPSDKYFTATEIQHFLIDKYELKEGEGHIIDPGYTDAINAIPLIGASPYFYGKLFLEIHHVAENDQTYSYELVHNADSLKIHPDSVLNHKTGNYLQVPSLFLKAHKNIEGLKESKADVKSTVAFDLESFIKTNENKLDSISQDRAINQLYVYLYYQSENDTIAGEIIPNYKLAHPRPVVISTFLD